MLNHKEVAEVELQLKIKELENQDAFHKTRAKLNSMPKEVLVEQLLAMTCLYYDLKFEIEEQ